MREYPITYVPVWRAVDFMAKDIVEPLFVLAFYGLKKMDVTESHVMNALIRRRLRLRDFDWEVYDCQRASTDYVERKIVPREYIRRGITA